MVSDKLLGIEPVTLTVVHPPLMSKIYDIIILSFRIILLLPIVQMSSPKRYEDIYMSCLITFKL